MNSYYKISDIVFRFDSNTVLKFNTVLSYVDGNGNLRYSHNEYQYPLNRNSKEQIVRGVVRHSNYFLSIESKNYNINLNLYLKLKSGDFYQFKKTFIRYMENPNNTNNVTMQFESGQFVTLSRTSDYNITIDCNSLYKIHLEGFRAIEFVSILEEINMLQMWNNHMIYMTSNNFLGEFDNLGALESLDNDNIGVETKSGYTVKPKVKENKSFFDL